MKGAIDDEEVKAAFGQIPHDARKQLLAIRDLIFSTADSIDGVGEIEETLKWGEPAYITSKSKSGSTIRLGWKESAPDQCAVYFNCQTTLVDAFRTLHPDLHFQGNRAIVFDVSSVLPTEELAHCLGMALTYHMDKKQRRRTSN